MPARAISCVGRRVTARPRSMAIIGGGYIGVEYAHFFAAMGTSVTLIEAAERLVPGEEPEVAALLKHALRKRMQVLTDIAIEQIVRGPRDIRLLVKERRSGARFAVTVDTVMVATGRRSNADLLQVDRTGVHTDERGFVTVNDAMETNVPGIYAVGDANGRHTFRHIANLEATLAAKNAFGGRHDAMDYSAAPHAVYSYPQIAAVGLTTEEVVAARPSYRPYDCYAGNPVLKQAIDLIREGFFSPDDRGLFQPLVDLLLNEDRYMVLADFDAYHRAQMEIDALYCDSEAWTKRSILNVARIGKFSSDRTILEYNRDIWHAVPLTVERNHVGRPKSDPANGEAPGAARPTRS